MESELKAVEDLEKRVVELYQITNERGKYQHTIYEIAKMVGWEKSPSRVSEVAHIYGLHRIAMGRRRRVGLGIREIPVETKQRIAEYYRRKDEKGDFVFGIDEISREFNLTGGGSTVSKIATEMGEPPRIPFRPRKPYSQDRPQRNNAVRTLNFVRLVDPSGNFLPAPAPMLALIDTAGKFIKSYTMEEIIEIAVRTLKENAHREGKIE